jgi:hypothetical protein
MAGYPPKRGDDGSLVIGWLGRIAITVALVGIMLFDGIAMIRGHLHAENTAQAAADAAASTFTSTHDYEAALTAARTAAIDGDETMSATGFSIAHGFVIVTLDGHVDTLILGHVPGLSGAANPTITIREALPAS